MNDGKTIYYSSIIVHYLIMKWITINNKIIILLVFMYKKIFNFSFLTITTILSIFSFYEKKTWYTSTHTHYLLTKTTTLYSTD